jgi:hypothetical protein
MEGKIEAAVVTFLVVIASIAFYHLVVKSYLPAKAQGWIGI